jgi:hypothetical protein
MTNYFYMYRIFFEKAIPENRKEKKDSITVNSMRTGVNVRIVFFSREPDYFSNFT